MKHYDESFYDSKGKLYQVDSKGKTYRLDKGVKRYFVRSPEEMAFFNHDKENHTNLDDKQILKDLNAAIKAWVGDHQEELDEWKENSGESGKMALGGFIGAHYDRIGEALSSMNDNYEYDSANYSRAMELLDQKFPGYQ